VLGEELLALIFEEVHGEGFGVRRGGRGADPIRMP
jgi:hypothetical protein